MNDLIYEWMTKFKVNDESQFKQSEVTHTFPPSKIFWKKHWEKINIDVINWGKLFDRSVDHK